MERCRLGEAFLGGCRWGEVGPGEAFLDEASMAIQLEEAEAWSKYRRKYMW